MPMRQKPLFPVVLNGFLTQPDWKHGCPEGFDFFVIRVDFKPFIAHPYSSARNIVIFISYIML
jgi:hypothetical protein